MTYVAVDMGQPSGATLSTCFASTPDGTTIVGSTDYNGDGNPLAFIWTSAAPFVPMGQLPMGANPTPGSQATGISADGVISCGASNGGSAGGPYSGSFFNTEAFIWTSGGGMIGLGFLGSGDGSQANAISADGSTVVGSSNVTPGAITLGSLSLPFVWTSGGGMTGLPLLAGDVQGAANAVNADGSVIVGFSMDSSNNQKPVVWTSGGVTPISLPSPMTTGVAFAVNASGSVIAGSMAAVQGGTQIVFIDDSGTVALLAQPFAQTQSMASGISAVGDVVVGTGNGSSGPGQSWVWTTSGGYVDLPPLPGNTFCAVTGISANGIRPFGESVFPTDAVYWVAPSSGGIVVDGLVREALVGIGVFGCGPFPIFPPLPVGFPVKVSIVMDTVVGTTKSLREMRVAQRVFPLWDIEILFEELRDQTQNVTPDNRFTGFKQYQQLCQLWLMMYGQTNLFAFDCPWDDSRTNQTIGRGNGATTVFTIYRTWGEGATATIAPIGLINLVFNVSVDGTTIPSSQYTLGRNSITFGTPPANGSIITMTFSFYYLCRFVEDEQDFEEFAKNRWTVTSLKFRAVLWADF
jgi:uncharacterized membrane protein